MESNGRYGPDIIETTDEDGQVHIFEKVDEYEIEGQRYALLIYQGSEEEDDEAETEEATQAASEGDDEEDDEEYDEEVVVMRVVMDGDDQVYESIDDKDEFDRVVAFIEKIAAEEGFELEIADHDEEEESDS
ncbi:MAG: DUF1292 domain-containing protein [Cyanobacteria bacterium]|nr:DUF1292 domain-containing protein [Cyanobacteriota bacterium]